MPAAAEAKPDSRAPVPGTMNHTSVRMALLTQFPGTCPESSKRGMQTGTAACPGGQKGPGRNLARKQLLGCFGLLLSLVLWKSVSEQDSHMPPPSTLKPLSMPPSPPPLQSPGQHLLLPRGPASSLRTSHPSRNSSLHTGAGFVSLRGGLPCHSVPCF